MSHLVMGMYVLGTFIFLGETYRDPSFAPMLILFIPIAIYNVFYVYAAPNTCVIVSTSGIEYQRPEFSIAGRWSQIKALKRTIFLSMLGLRYYIILEEPTISYTKWLGFGYRLLLGDILSPNQQKRIPLGKMWQDYEELENELRAHVPSLSLDAPKNKKAG